MPTNMNELHKWQPPVKVTTDDSGRVLSEEPIPSANDLAVNKIAEFVHFVNSSQIHVGATEGLEALFADGCIPDISDHIMAHLFLQWIGAREDADCTDLNREGKAAALEFAEVFGSDHAQALYRFAVLVTKLA
jgi:hypothetical protein